MLRWAVIFLFFLMSCGVQVEDSQSTPTSNGFPVPLNTFQLAQQCISQGSVQSVFAYHWNQPSNKLERVEQVSIITPFNIFLDFTGNSSSGTSIRYVLTYHGAAGDVVLIDRTRSNYLISTIPDGLLDVDFNTFGITPTASELFTIEIYNNLILDNGTGVNSYPQPLEKIDFKLKPPVGVGVDQNYVVGTVKPLSSDTPYCPAYYTNMFSISEQHIGLYAMVSPAENFFEAFSLGATTPNFIVDSLRMRVIKESDSSIVSDSDISGFSFSGGSAFAIDFPAPLSSIGWYQLNINIILRSRVDGVLKSVTSNVSGYRFELRSDHIIYDDQGKRLFETGMGYTEWRTKDLQVFK